ncbi:MAG: NfeD family protein [Caulobacteraceae bacterium]|nr:NfeD family protein [Caulobacteraceae bacterium]
MPDVTALIVHHPFWDWAGVAALLLALEVGTATGYLLWPAASAGVVALVQLVARPGPVADILTFAVLTLASTLLARRFLPRRLRQPGPDINDRARGLIGQSGQAVGAFTGGRGRVFVGGAEWIAEMDEAAPSPAPGATVKVVDVLGGGRLKVEAA